MIPNVPGCYEILNTVNGKRYIGSAVALNKRWNLHLANLRKGNHHSSKLQRSWNKHGPEAFKFLPILFCQKSMLRFYEQQLLDKVKPEYNNSPTAGTRLGMKNKPEATAKTAAALRGGKHTAEHSYKTGSAHRGKPCPEDVKVKISKALTGITRGPLPAETRRKIGDANRGNTHTPETRTQIGNILRGRKKSPFTPEHCANISVARRAYIAQQKLNQGDLRP